MLPEKFFKVQSPICRTIESWINTKFQMTRFTGEVIVKNKTFCSSVVLDNFVLMQVRPIEPNQFTCFFEADFEILQLKTIFFQACK